MRARLLLSPVLVLFIAGCVGNDPVQKDVSFSFQAGNTQPSSIVMHVQLLDATGAVAIERSYDLPAHTKTALEPLVLREGPYSIRATAAELQFEQEVLIREPLNTMHIMFREARLELLTTT